MFVYARSLKGKIIVGGGGDVTVRACLPQHNQFLQMDLAIMVGLMLLLRYYQRHLIDCNLSDMIPYGIARNPMTSYHYSSTVLYKPMMYTMFSVYVCGFVKAL